MHVCISVLGQSLCTTYICALLDLSSVSSPDIIGVVKSAGELTSITTRQTNRKVSKRDIQLVDKTDRVVSLTLWGAEAEAFDGSKNPVLVIRGARVSDFGGMWDHVPKQFHWKNTV